MPSFGKTVLTDRSTERRFREAVGLHIDRSLSLGDLARDNAGTIPRARNEAHGGVADSLGKSGSSQKAEE